MPFTNESRDLAIQASQRCPGASVRTWAPNDGSNKVIPKATTTVDGKALALWLWRFVPGGTLRACLAELRRLDNGGYYTRIGLLGSGEHV